MEFIANLFGVSEQVALYIVIGVGIVIALIIVLIIVGILSKKKKAEVEDVPVRKLEKVKGGKTNEGPEKVIGGQSKQIEGKLVEKQEIEVEEAKEKETLKVEEAKVDEVKIDRINKQIKKAEEAVIEANEPVIQSPLEKKVEPSSKKYTGKYEIYPINDSFVYRLKASNGEIMVVSELYKSAKGAESAIETVKKNANDGLIQIHKDKHGLWQFKLFAGNKRLIVSSANYKTEARCESASNSFKRFAADAPVIKLDETPDNFLELVDISNIEEKDSGKIDIEQTDEGYVFNLHANNKQILCTSIAYATKKSVESAIETVKEAVKSGKIYVSSDKNDVYQFKLYSEAGRVLVTGEAYGKKVFAIDAANSFASFIGKATLVEGQVEDK